MMEELFASCRELHKISPEAAEAYAQVADRLLSNVADQLETNPKIQELNGCNSFDMMRNNHHEFHEIGARMVADFMEMDGWDVTYLGANTPAAELLYTLKQHKPFVVALSVATVFNLDSARQIIKMINEDQETRDIKVMVGGLAFSGMPHLWQAIGADGYAADAESALHVSNDWWTAENSTHA
ncbi:MAG: cobalamin B12-binding domain-containing protein [Desulfuromonadaceae bacterium]